MDREISSKIAQVHSDIAYQLQSLRQILERVGEDQRKAYVQAAIQPLGEVMIGIGEFLNWAHQYTLPEIELLENSEIMDFEKRTIRGWPLLVDGKRAYFIHTYKLGTPPVDPRVGGAPEQRFAAIAYAYAEDGSLYEPRGYTHTEGPGTDRRALAELLAEWVVVQYLKDIGVPLWPEAVGRVRLLKPFRSVTLFKRDLNGEG